MAPARRSAFLLPALALTVGLVGYTCSLSSSEYDDYSAYSAEMGQATEAHQTTSVTSTTHAQYEPLTPSQYIRDFVESVFRGEADKKLEDSGESLRPKNLSVANPGFNQYWPAGEWAYTKAELEFCNTSADACSVIYKNYGKLCASDMFDKHDTFDNWCELNDDNCRDGTANVWATTGYECRNYRWLRVSQSPVWFYMRQREMSQVVISGEKGCPENERYYVISFGMYDSYTKSYQTVVIRRRMNYNSGAPLARADFKKASWEYRFNIYNDHVKLIRIQFNGTTGFISVNIMDNALYWHERYIYYSDSVWKSFDVKYIGIGGGSTEKPSWYYVYGLARGWLPVYRGPCQPPLATVPTENPNKIREKVNIDLYNFAGRMDEFGYWNHTRLLG